MGNQTEQKLESEMETRIYGNYECIRLGSKAYLLAASTEVRNRKVSGNYYVIRDYIGGYYVKMVLL